MKQEVIEQMRTQLYDTDWCRKDFEIYSKTLKETTEPFFWMVREYGTSLVKLGVSEIQRWFSNEVLRMAIFREMSMPLDSLMYYTNSGCGAWKLFYLDGLTLTRISKMDMLTIFNNLVCAYWADKTNEFKEEFNMCNKPLEIKFASIEAERAFNQSLEYAKELNDNSLNECVSRLSKWVRIAVDHCIVLSCDFTEHGFYFQEKVNGEPKICGGIIMDKSAKEKRWSTHT